MNPFALPGPQFLLFYALFAAAVLLALYFGRRLYEGGPLPKLDAKDPYLFACLNAGPSEVIRVKTIGLLDRNLLQISGDRVRTAPGVKPGAGATRLEKEILEHFESPAALESAFGNSRTLAVASAAYEPQLRAFRLIPDAEIEKLRGLSLGVAIVALGGVGGWKVLTALSAGRSNVWFLIIMTVVALVVALKIWNPYRTSLGDDYLASVRSLFAGLRGRADSIRPGGSTREILWLTALFGVASLPAAAFPFVEQFRPKQTASGGSCGSSCGSSSGCGGGGGGGCGGCGS